MQAANEQTSIIGGEWHPLRHIARGVWLSSLRRNEIYIVLILLGVYLAGAAVLRIVGIDSEQTARFVAGLGLELGSLFGSLLVIVMGARQIPVELEQRTLYPVLAKPVTRGQVLAGKALPTWCFGMIATILFALVTLAVTPRLEYQRVAALGEALLLKAVALGMLTMFVFWLALWMPASLAMLTAGLVAFLGNVGANALAGAGEAGWIFAGLIPDFRLFEQFSRFVDGGELLSAGTLAGLTAYGALWISIFGGLALVRFRHQSL